MGDQGYSGDTLASMSYSPANKAFTLLSTVSDGENGTSLTLSPDGRHLAYTAGGGNGNPSYTVWDLDASDITQHSGEWDIGPYPSAADFRHDSRTVAISGGYELELFDLASHASMGGWSLVDANYAPSCIGRAHAVRWSPSGRYLYELDGCYEERVSAVRFAVLPGPQRAPLDFSADGKSDILWTSNDGSTALWLMDGTTATGSAGLLGAGSGWTAKLVADFDGHGKSDILWQHENGTVVMWLMDGISIKSGAQLPRTWIRVDTGAIG
jgi:Tol biopolymer transport system component